VFCAGALFLLLLYLLYNRSTTGSFTESPYQLSGNFESNTFGFGGTHSVALGMQNEQVLLALMLLVVNGWPLWIGMMFAAMPFILGSRNRWDYFFAVCALALAATMMYYPDEAIMHGPRYWYETMPFFILLMARGIVRLAEASSSAGDWLARVADWRPAVSGKGAANFAVISLVTVLVGWSAWGWMFQKTDLWPQIEFTPRKIKELEGFNSTDARLLDAASDMNLHDALILVEPCPQWWCYGSVFWANNVTLDGDVVWAKRLGDENDVKLLEHYKGRKLYVADYNTGTIRPTTEESVLGGIETPPPATPTPGPGETPQPVVTPTPSGSASERDAERRQALEELRVAAEQYADEHGFYPTTDSQSQTLCVYETLDSGCHLKEFLPDLPQEPLGNSPSDGFWYWSDGASFVITALRETGDEQPGQCPEKAGRPAGDRMQQCVEGSRDDAVTPTPPS
jgi:hypothetical protein